jgi:hypothetical protein
MTSIQYILVIFITTFSSICFGQNECNYQIDTAKILANENLDSFLIKIKQEDFEVSHDKKDIPDIIKKALDRWTGGFSIANPKESYNATDMRTDRLPDRQLLFLAINQEIFLMSYLHGGIGEHGHILFVKFYDGQILDVWTGVCEKDLDSKSQVLHYVKTRRNKDGGLNTNIICF